MKSYFDTLEELVPKIVERNKNARRKLNKIEVLYETKNYINLLKVSDHDFLQANELKMFLEMCGDLYVFLVEFESKKVIWNNYVNWAGVSVGLRNKLSAWMSA